MDGAGITGAELADCLADLEWLNRWSRAYAPTLGWLSRITPPARPLRIVDVGCGRGDMLRRIWRWAVEDGRQVELLGLDINPAVVAIARAATPPSLPIRYATADLFQLPAHGPVDIILSSLFAHHLPSPMLLRFLALMETEARVGWFVNDLHRHRLPYLFLRALFATVPFDRLVRHDGPISVARAFTRTEWEALLAEAGLPEERIEIGWYLPFRWGVGTRRCRS